MGPSQKLLFTFFLCSSILFLFGVEVVESTTKHHYHRHHHHHHHSGHHGHHAKRGGLEKLFVFGDSYADTGNNRIATGQSWKEPYGVTFPGKPSGRFSDGRVFTDYLAKYLGMKSPIPYTFRKYSHNNMKYGMNFAYGGTGVFDTTAPYPNMTNQIDLFEQLLKDSVFEPSDLQNAMAHVSLVGNDYSYYLARGGSVAGFPAYITQVVNQLAVDVKRIYNLGVKRISVTALQPLGCLPRSTVVSSFQQCNETFNQAVAFHNLLLQQAVSEFNNQTTQENNGTPTIVIMDLYKAFFNVFQEKQTQQGDSKFDNPMKPCCTGINQNYYCGSVDDKGNKMYTVCQDPKTYFFWDEVHPTQAGWEALTTALQSNLQQLQR